MRPLFQEALEQGARVNLGPVNKILDDLLLDAPESGTLTRTAKKIQNLLKSPAGGQPSLGRLQKVKFELDSMLDTFGGDALGNSMKREVVLVKKALVEQMEKASPLFKEAQQKFQELSPAVKQLEESILGKVSQISEVNLKSISRRIFDTSEPNPNVIRSVKKAIEDVDPGAFDDLLRVELQRRIGGLETLGADLPGGLVGNVPGKLRTAIFGNPIQRQALLSGMSTEQRKNFVYLDTLLGRVSTGRAPGSPTASFGEVLAGLRGPIRTVVEFITGPRTAAKEVFGTVSPKKVAALADVLFNPKWQPKLQQLRRLDIDSKRAENLLKDLLTASEKTAPQALRQNNDTGG